MVGMLSVRPVQLTRLNLSSWSLANSEINYALMHVCVYVRMRVFVHARCVLSWELNSHVTSHLSTSDMVCDEFWHLNLRNVNKMNQWAFLPVWLTCNTLIASHGGGNWCRACFLFGLISSVFPTSKLKRFAHKRACCIWMHIARTTLRKNTKRWQSICITVFVARGLCSP